MKKTEPIKKTELNQKNRANRLVFGFFSKITESVSLNRFQFFFKKKINIIVFWDKNWIIYNRTKISYPVSEFKDIRPPVLSLPARTQIHIANINMDAYVSNTLKFHSQVQERIMKGVGGFFPHGNEIPNTFMHSEWGSFSTFWCVSIWWWWFVGRPAYSSLRDDWWLCWRF
jgi:hypothetical protein